METLFRGKILQPYDVETRRSMYNVPVLNEPSCPLPPPKKTWSLRVPLGGSQLIQRAEQLTINHVLLNREYSGSKERLGIFRTLRHGVYYVQAYCFM